MTSSSSATKDEIKAALEAAQKHDLRLKELDELLEFARERRAFGTLTEIQNRGNPDEGQKPNKTGEAYGSGYEEAAMDFFNEITRRIKLLSEASAKSSEKTTG